MAAAAITVLKHNAPWGPFTRAQIDEGLKRGDYTVQYLAHAEGLSEWLPLGEVIDYVDRRERLAAANLPPVPGPAISIPPIPPPIPKSPESARDLTPPPVPSAVPKPVDPPVTARPEPQLPPARFVPRAFAFIIDCLILFLPVAAIYGIGAMAIEIPGAWNKISHQQRMEEWGLLIQNTKHLALLVAIGIGWLYGAGLESSRRQATIGKRWMGIIVTDMQGERISFMRASGRYAAKYLSALPAFLGFIWALFGSRNLAWHDRLSGTRAIRK